MTLAKAWIWSLAALLGLASFVHFGGFEAFSPWSWAALALGYSAVAILPLAGLWLSMSNADIHTNARLRRIVGFDQTAFRVLATSVFVLILVLAPVALIAADGPLLHAAIVLFILITPVSLGALAHGLVIKMQLGVAQFYDASTDIRATTNQAELPIDVENRRMTREALATTVVAMRDAQTRASAEPLTTQDALQLLYTQAFTAYGLLLVTFSMVVYILEVEYGFGLTIGEPDWGRTEYYLFATAWIADIFTLGLLDHFDISISSLRHDPSNIGFSLIFYAVKATGAALLLSVLLGSAASHARYVDAIAQTTSSADTSPTDAP